MKDPMNILLLEDSVDDVGLIERELRKQGMLFHSRCVDTEDAYVNALTVFKPDVILSDHGLPQFNSIDALKIAQHLKCDVPFILVTGSVSEEFAVSCLKQGADDYVLKSNLVRLPSAILGSLRQRQADSQRKSAEVALRTQNEQLLKINRELDSFVYSVSHNLRAPLMSVLGLVNILQLENDQSANEHYFDMMQSSIHKLDETLKEILEYSRNARGEVNLGEVNISRIIDDCFERLMYIKGSDSIDRTIRIEGETRIHSDAYRIGLIMSNLISNAIKYRDEKKSRNQIDILVSITSEQIQIVFRDNGVGIQSDYVPKIFNMFFRATEKSEGAGLGLYIVKETVDKLEGSIRVNSVFGEGTTFFIQLPNVKSGK